MKKVSIIMPIYHQAKMTIAAIESIYEKTKDVEIELIAVVDGYERALNQYFRKRKEPKVIYHRHNIGFIKSVNDGLDAVSDDADYILLLNNDILIEYDDWLIKLVNTFDKDTAAVAPVSNFVMGLQNLTCKDFPQIHYSKFLIGFCMLVRKDVFDIIGKLDERFGMGGNDDLDLSIRMRLLGLNLKVNRGVFVHHVGSQSLPMTMNVSDQDKRTRILLNNKWGQYFVDDLFKYSDKFIREGE